MQRIMLLSIICFSLVACDSSNNEKNTSTERASATSEVAVKETNNNQNSEVQNKKNEADTNVDAAKKESDSTPLKEEVDGINVAISSGGLLGDDGDLPGVPPKADEFTKRHPDKYAKNNSSSDADNNIATDKGADNSSQINGSDKSEELDYSYLESIKEIYVGISPDYPPFESLIDGNLTGFDVDVINEIAQRLQKRIHFVQMPFYSLVASLGAEKVDVVISSMSATKERMEAVNFSAPYYKAKLAFVSMADSPENRKNLFKGARIGVQTGSVMNEWLRSLEDEQIIRIVRDSNIQLIEELRSGNIDLLLVEKAQAETIIANPGKDMEYSVATEEIQSYSIATKHKSRLSPFIDKAINDMIADGTLQQLEKKWKLSHESAS